MRSSSSRNRIFGLSVFGLVRADAGVAARTVAAVCVAKCSGVKPWTDRCSVCNRRLVGVVMMCRSWLLRFVQTVRAEIAAAFITSGGNRQRRSGFGVTKTRLLSRAPHRQHHGKFGPHAFLGVDFDLPTVLLHDLVDDRQPKPSALPHLLGREERIKDLRQYAFGDTNAVVDHL